MIGKTIIITTRIEIEYKKTKFREMTIDELGDWARENYENYAEFVKSPLALQNVILEGLQQRKNLTAVQLLDFFFKMKYGRERKPNPNYQHHKFVVEGFRKAMWSGKSGGKRFVHKV